MEKILANVLRKIKPSPKEEEKVKKFVSEVLRVSKTVSGLDAFVVGSIGKFTWLSGDHDVDVFLMFPGDTPREDLEKRGLEYGKKIAEHLKGKWKIKYAEHPYTHAMIKGFDVDIVPCYRMAKGGHVKSAVDRSPLHLEYVLSHLTPRMQDEVRLLKQFCKGVGVYGSDAKHLGFSGYICELLILYYGTFENAVKAAAGWKAPQVVELAGFTEKSRFPNQPLIIADPTDRNRNAAAAVSAENFVKFVVSAGQFAGKPGGHFFTPKPPVPLSEKQIKYLRSRGTHFLAVRMKKPDVIDDVLYPQMRKALKRLRNLMHHNEFSVIRDNEFAGDRNAYLIYELEIFRLPPVNNQEGPPVFARRHVDEFLSKYRGKNFVYIDNSRLIAEVRRENTAPAELLTKFLRRDREQLLLDGVPSYIAEVAGKASLIEQNDFFALLKKDKQLSGYLRERYFTGFVSRV